MIAATSVPRTDRATASGSLRAVVAEREQRALALEVVQVRVRGAAGPDQFGLYSATGVDPDTIRFSR